jgi:hypothetical protein
MQIPISSSSSPVKKSLTDEVRTVKSNNTISKRAPVKLSVFMIVLSYISIVDLRTEKLPCQRRSFALSGGIGKGDSSRIYLSGAETKPLIRSGLHERHN